MSKAIIPVERVVQSIRWIRGQKVLFDSDLAALYCVTTGNLNKAVNRNRDRFPSDFMFQLSAEEAEDLISKLEDQRGVAAGAIAPTRSLNKESRCSQAF